MYKLILLSFFLVSCGTQHIRLNSNDRSRLDCVDYLLDKNIGMDDALSACKYAVRGEKSNGQK
jgi:hypothetical protein